MAYFKSRKHFDARISTSQAAAMSLALASLNVYAAEPATRSAAPAEGTLPAVSVKAKREIPYKAETSSSTKLTQPLLDTPKTVQVIKKEVLREQGAVSLMDALRNTPGITMQLGENGNTTAGDAFQMRGFSTEGSIFVDGIRDVGAVSRDVFNVEQVEVVKGPSGSETGRGTASGYVNLVTKVPLLDEVTDLNLSYGSANRKRASTDLNRRINDNTAVRLNVMAYHGDVDGVDVAKKSGIGIAPSVAVGLGTPLRFFAQAQHVNTDDIPSGGIPSVGLPGFYRGATAPTPTTGTPTNGPQITTADEAAYITSQGRAVDRSNFYGSNKDYFKTESNAFSFKAEFDLSSATTLRNITRVTRSHADRVLTSVGAINGMNVRSGNASGSGTLLPVDQWTVNRSRQRIDQTNKSLVNQTSINSSQVLAGLKHDLAAGLELMSESQRAPAFNGDVTPNPAASLYHPNANDVLAVPTPTGVVNYGKTVTKALYALDTVTINEAFKLNGGLRVEHYKITTVTTNAPLLKKSDTLVSWNAGAVFKPAKNGSIYAAAANTKVPPGGNNYILSATATNQSSPTMDPQEAKTIELGTKWDLLDQKLNVSVAVFRTENDKQTSVDPQGVTSQFGKTRIQGLELGAVGQLTNFWQVTGGVSFLDAKALDQYSRNTGATVNTQTTGVRYTPKVSATAWTSYTLEAFTLGGGVRYIGELKRLVSDQSAATQPLPTVPGYEVVDLMAAYRLSKKVNLQLNVQNVFDKKYVTVNNAGTRFVIGAPRSFDVSANFTF